MPIRSPQLTRAWGQSFATTKFFLRRAALACVAIASALLAACGGSGSSRDHGDSTQRSFAPLDPANTLFWVRFTAETADALRDIVDNFNSDWHGPPVVADYIGGYGQIYTKVSASIQAGSVPAMAVSYESMTADYAAAGAVVPLDAFIADPALGLTQEDLADFHAAVLESNRFDELGGGMYSFPFAKSVLMLYFNKRVMAEAGIDTPPRTWDEFLEQSRAVKASTGKFAYALDVDCSTFNAFLMSKGGAILKNGRPQYDSPEAIAVLQLYETLIQEGLAYQIPKGSWDDEAALAQDEIAFRFRSSAGRASVKAAMEDDSRWGMAMIPQADPDSPATVLFGPNITVFATTPAQQEAAWAFTRHFTGPEVSVEWALRTGYLPIRKSAASDSRVLAFWNEWPYNRAAYDCLPFARPEPNLRGWQAVRGLVERAVEEVINGMATPEAAASRLQSAVERELARAAGSAR